MHVALYGASGKVGVLLVPALEDADLSWQRADEEVDTGLIHVGMIEQLGNACCNFLTPASVTLVLVSSRRVSLVSPFRCSRPASLISVSLRCNP